MKSIKSQKGQALVVIALAAVVLFGFAALAIDGSRVFSDRRHAQNAADTSALAAALARVRGQDYSSAGLNRATTNGYSNDADSTVEVHLCSETGIVCQGIPTGEDPSEYILVKIISTIPTTFARVIGTDHITSTLTAVAHAKPTELKPLAQGAALAALKPTGPKTIDGNGNIVLDVNNSGVFNNSTDNCGMNVVGNGNYSVDTAFEFVSGQHCQSGNPTLNGPQQSAPPMPYPPEIKIPTPSITCSGNGSSSTNGNTTTYSPGNYNAITINGGKVNFDPGNYCFNGDVKINGNTTVIANSVNFLITAGEFSINANSNFTCNDVLVYINGGTGMKFNGTSEIYCNSITFYAATGSVSWLGTVSLRLYAPEGGDYAHVLIYLPYGNDSALSITGNSGNELTGSIIAVSSPITIAGNSGTAGLHSQIIGYTIGLLGNSNTTINYVADEQFTQLDPNSIQITK